MSITSQDRLDLKRMMSEMDCGDNTENIRNAKQSVVLRDEIRKLELFKQNNQGLRNAPERFKESAMNECPILYNNYMDIFNKVLNDELDLDIMSKLLQILKMIEDGNVDQHEGSVLVGKLLKELYLDSAVKKADKLDSMYDSEKVVPIEAQNKISWREYKAVHDK